MPRPPRIFFAGAIHHITARGNNKMTLFQDAHDFRVYRKLWIMAKTRFELKVFRWAFMTNHIHLLLKQIKGAGVSEAMHFVQGRYARYFGKKYNWKGHVWEDRYSNRIVADEKYYLYCAQYIENNPVKAGMVVKADDYSWSSAAFYSRHHRDPLTDPDPYLDQENNAISHERGKGELFIGRRAVGGRALLQRLSEKVGKNLLVTSNRSTCKI